jgi:hypothetical protein
MPAEQRKGIIAELPKKGNLIQSDNWRGIMLLSLPSKIFSRKILNQIKDAIGQHMRKKEAGFCKNSSCNFF